VGGGCGCGCGCEFVYAMRLSAGVFVSLCVRSFVLLCCTVVYHVRGLVHCMFVMLWCLVAVRSGVFCL